MPVHSIVPILKGSIGGSYYEDRYYTSNDYVSYYWQTSAAYYPDIINLEVYINNALHSSYSREELLQNNGYITYVDYGVSKDSSANIRIVGCDKFDNCIEKNVNIDTSGRDLSPKVMTGPSKHTDLVSIPSYVGAYQNALYVEVFFKGSLHTTLDLDRLQLGGNETIKTEDNNASWELKVIAYNKYEEPSVPAILKSKQ